MNKIIKSEKYSFFQLRKSCLIAGSCFLLSGCFSLKSHGPEHKTAPGNEEIALFLPLSGTYAPVASQLKNAAMLGFAEGDGVKAANVKLFDTASMTPKAAAQAAIAEKAAMVLGPITADATQEASSVLLPANIPEISFTSDARNEKEGLWVAGLTARQQVARLVQALKEEEKFSVAAFLPSNDFGRSFGDALTELCKANNFPEPQIVYHDDSAENIAQTLQMLAKTQERHDLFEKSKETASSTILPPPPFQALLLADTGINLRNIIDYLPDSGITTSEVQIMGPALWRAFDAKLAAIQGAWYAAPNDEGRQAYVQKYEETYHQKPLMITDMAYDLAVLTKKLQGTNTLSSRTLLNEEGFQGIGGKFSFERNGRVNRELALYQILPSGGAKMVLVKPIEKPKETP